MTARLTEPAAATADRAARADARIVIQAWIASRGLIALVALLLALVEHRTLTDMVSNWDVQHFTRLAEGGYLAEPDNILMAFFPGLPVLLSMGTQVGIPVAVAGVIISAVCSGIAAAALYRLGGTWAAVAWLFAPTAVFTTVPYTESLFCAAAFWAWERARSDRWLAAAGLAAIACSVRVSGLFLIGALAVMIITSRVGWRTTISRASSLLIPAAVLAGFAAYLYALTGSWTAWYAAQSTGWVRGLTLPWDSFRNTIPAIVPGAYADHPWWAAVFRGEMVSMAVGVAVVVWCVVVSIRRRRFDKLSDRASPSDGCNHTFPEPVEGRSGGRFDELSDRVLPSAERNHTFPEPVEGRSGGRFDELSDRDLPSAERNHTFPEPVEGRSGGRFDKLSDRALPSPDQRFDKLSERAVPSGRCFDELSDRVLPSAERNHTFPEPVEGRSGERFDELSDRRHTFPERNHTFPEPVEGRSGGRFDKLSDRDLPSGGRFDKLSDRGLWAEGSWVGVQVLAFSLSYWFFSVNRATLLWFPLWMMIGGWVGRRSTTGAGRVVHRCLVAVAFLLEIVLMIWWSWLFFTGHWAS